MSKNPSTRILVGVSGGIAAYKTCELVRELKRSGRAQVRVVMTEGAQSFVTPLTFQALSGAPVRTELLDARAESGMDHIALARWADRIVVAPASADLIARYAQGLANDLLTTLLLATTAPVWLAPAMNHGMWKHPATQANVQTLLGRGVTLLGPDEGDQACGEQGPGRMREPAAIARTLLQHDVGPLAGQPVLITAGPTFEPIDPVRFIGNRSSGRMGFALAAAARDAGARVTLIHGPSAEPLPAEVEGIAVETAAAMREAVLEHLPSARLLIAAAAVADYRPVAVQAQKIKKSGPGMTLELERTEDILAEVGRRAVGAERPFLVGFAAETERLREHAEAKREAKGLDLIAANLVGDGRAFGTPDNELLCLWEGGECLLPLQSKPQLARRLIELIVERMNESSTRNR